MKNICFLFRRGELWGKGKKSSLLIPVLVYNSEDMPTEKKSVWSLIRSSNKIILFLWFILAGVPINAQFSGGSGTIADPYLIANFTDLVTISSSSTYWNKHFKQTANIDASTSSTLNSGAGFEPIANPTNKFTGSYIGQNYEITDLVVNRASTSSVGLFGEVSGATVKDLKLVGAKITGSNNVGGFVGWTGASTTLQNLSIDSTSIIIGADDVGGIVGEAKNTEVTDCSSWASVDGNDNTGGLIGFCDLDGTSKSVTNCFAAGIVTGDGDEVGGLIGVNEQTVTNCYSTASVTSLDATGDDNYGGLIGLNVLGTIRFCYSTGKVSASGNNIGGLIGNSSGTVENCYSTSQVRGDNDVGGLIGESIAAISNCFALGSVNGNDDTGGLIGYQNTGGTVTLSYAAVRVINTSDSEVGGLIGDRSGSVTKCFWIDLYSDDNALLPDESNEINSNIKVVSNHTSAAVAHPLSALRGSNAVSTMTDFNFTDTWQIATTVGPGTFPVLRNLTAPLVAPIGPTGFVVNGGNGVINLEWDANVETDITSYHLYRSTTINFNPGPTELLAIIPDTTTGRFFYSDSGAGSLAAPQNGTLYHYVLVAVDINGNISLPHKGSAKPGINLATVSVSIVSGGITYTDSHGNISPDVYAVFSDSTGGNITNTNSIDSDGCGDEQGVFHSRSVTTGNITITPSGLQNGQKWYFFYDDNTVSGYPIRNFTGGAGSGTTLVTGTGNTPITITSGLDGEFTDYLFYVDVPPGINREPLITGLTDSSICLNGPFVLDADLVLYDSNASILNGGFGNYNGFQLVVQRRGGGNIDDLFSFLSPGTGYVVGMGTISFGGEQVATFTNSSGTLDIQFSGTEVIPTQVIVHAIARSIAYDNNISRSFLDTVELDWIFKDGLLSDTSTQKIILKAPHTVSASASASTLCINTSLTNITHTTTGATGIGTATGLPAGVTATWASNMITINGTPTTSGTFNYIIPLIGGCGNVNATGTITVNPDNTVGAASSTPTLCINTALTNITHTTTGAT
ncbi:MAG: hypothetical protein NWQ39_02810, partial [Saprospiraceae bacterium]|nr:hypothetical protein [Saprospiraceae bacterium]